MNTTIFLRIITILILIFKTVVIVYEIYLECTLEREKNMIKPCSRQNVATGRFIMEIPLDAYRNDGAARA